MTKLIEIKDPRSDQPDIPGLWKLAFAGMLGAMLNKACFQEFDNRMIAKAVIAEMRVSGTCAVPRP